MSSVEPTRIVAGTSYRRPGTTTSSSNPTSVTAAIRQPAAGGTTASVTSLIGGTTAPKTVNKHNSLFSIAASGDRMSASSSSRNESKSEAAPLVGGKDGVLPPVSVGDRSSERESPASVHMNPTPNSMLLHFSGDVSPIPAGDSTQHGHKPSSPSSNLKFVADSAASPVLENAISPIDPLLAQAKPVAQSGVDNSGLRSPFWKKTHGANDDDNESAKSPQPVANEGALPSSAVPLAPKSGGGQKDKTRLARGGGIAIGGVAAKESSQADVSNAATTQSQPTSAPPSSSAAVAVPLGVQIASPSPQIPSSPQQLPSSSSSTAANGPKAVPTDDPDIVAIRGGGVSRSAAHAAGVRASREESTSKHTLKSKKSATAEEDSSSVVSTSCASAASQSENDESKNRTRDYAKPTVGTAMAIAAKAVAVANAGDGSSEQQRGVGLDNINPKTGRLGKVKHEPRVKKEPVKPPEGHVEVPLVKPRYERKTRTANQISVSDYASDSNLGTVSEMLHQASVEKLSIRHGDNYYEGTVQFHTYSVFRHGAKKIIAKSVGYASDGDLVFHRMDVGEKSDSNNDSFALIKRKTTEIHDAVCLDYKARRPMTDGEEEYLRRTKQINKKKHRKYPGVKAPKNKKIRQRLMNDAVTASEDFKKAFARAERRLTAERRARKAAERGSDYDSNDDNSSGDDSDDDDDSTTSESSLDSKGRLRPKARGTFQNVPPRYHKMMHQEEEVHNAYLERIGVNTATLHHTSAAKATPTHQPLDPNSAEGRFSLLNNRLKDEAKRALISEYLTGLIAELDQDFTDYIRFSVPQVALQTPPFGPTTPIFGSLPPPPSTTSGTGGLESPEFAAKTGTSPIASAQTSDYFFPTKTITDRSGFGFNALTPLASGSCASSQQKQGTSPLSLGGPAFTMQGGGGISVNGNTQSLIGARGSSAITSGRHVFPSVPASSAQNPQPAKSPQSPVADSTDDSHHPTPTAPNPPASTTHPNQTQQQQQQRQNSSMPPTPKAFGFGVSSARGHATPSMTEIERVASTLPDNAPPPLSYAFHDGYGRLICHAVATYYKLISASEEDKESGNRKTTVQFPESKRARAMSMVLPSMPFLQFLRMKTRNYTAAVSTQHGAAAPFVGTAAVSSTPPIGPAAVSGSPAPMMVAADTMPPPMEYDGDDTGAYNADNTPYGCGVPPNFSLSAQMLYSGVDHDGQPLTKTAVKKLKKEIKDQEAIIAAGGTIDNSIPPLSKTSDAKVKPGVMKKRS